MRTHACSSRCRFAGCFVGGQALAAELVAAEEARDVAVHALAHAAPALASEAQPADARVAKGGAHLRGQSPDAAFDLLKRTQVGQSCLVESR
jgi:hypothetical protein